MSGETIIRGAECVNCACSELWEPRAGNCPRPPGSLDIGTFASGTTSYRGSVGNPVTHVKLTPTVNDFGATVKVGKQGATLATVASGSASGAIPLSLGSNAITVEVTAPDRTTTQTYTVTVTRLGAAAVATVTLSASPAQVWEGQASRVTATLSHALPHGVLIPVTVTPCPEGSWCKRFNNYGILITAGDTVGHLRARSTRARPS